MLILYNENNLLNKTPRTDVLSYNTSKLTLILNYYKHFIISHITMNYIKKLTYLSFIKTFQDYFYQLVFNFIRIVFDIKQYNIA